MFEATQHDGERRFEMLVRAVYFGHFHSHGCFVDGGENAADACRYHSITFHHTQQVIIFEQLCENPVELSFLCICQLYFRRRIFQE